MYDYLLEGGFDKDSLIRCYMDEEEKETSPLMPYFDQTSFEAHLLKECKGKQLCYPSFKVANYLSMPA